MSKMSKIFEMVKSVNTPDQDEIAEIDDLDDHNLDHHFRTFCIAELQNVLNSRIKNMENVSVLLSKLIKTTELAKTDEAKTDAAKLKEAKTLLDQTMQETVDQIKRVEKIASNHQPANPSADGATADTIAALAAELKTQRDGIKLEGSKDIDLVL
jgi:nicotinamide mononucleotide adenylyltransferase